MKITNKPVFIGPKTAPTSGTLGYTVTWVRVVPSFHPPPPLLRPCRPTRFLFFGGFFFYQNLPTCRSIKLRPRARFFPAVSFQAIADPGTRRLRLFQRRDRTGPLLLRFISSPPLQVHSSDWLWSKHFLLISPRAKRHFRARRPISFLPFPRDQSVPSSACLLYTSALIRILPPL